MDKVLELLLGRPEMMLPVVKEYINKFKPIAYGLAQEVAEVLKDYSNNTEYPTVKAKIKRIYLMRMLLPVLQRNRH